MTSDKRFNRGLVVGKFCPLHRGHELLIEQALESCRDVVVISYTKPEFEGCSPTIRRAWIGTLFPHVTNLVIDDESLHALCLQRRLPVRMLPHNGAPDAVHREFIGWLCHEILHLTVDAVFTSEDYGDGFADALSVYFKARRNDVQRVRHVCVDKARQAIPVSGTAIRSDPHLHKDFLSPVVYASFVKRVCFLGGESSGKTTLARMLAEHHSTAWAPEYGRELWEARDGKLQFGDMVKVARQQVAREEQLAQQAHVWISCDTSPLTTLFYSMEMFCQADAQLLAMAERSYDVVFLCAPDFPFVQDGTRRDADFRARQHAWYCDELRKRGVDFVLLSGPIDMRLQEAISYLSLL